MAITFKITAKEKITDMKEFCRLNEELTYFGPFAKKETSEMLLGDIIQYADKFYTTALPGVSGISFSPADAEGMVTTTVKLFITNEYVPEECKPLSSCSIFIDVWDVHVDNGMPIVSYAFCSDQLNEAKHIVYANKDVDIFFQVGYISREQFLAM